jgi:hypothetical protein
MTRVTPASFTACFGSEHMPEGNPFWHYVANTAEHSAAATEDFKGMSAVQAHLFRDVLGNPFRPVPFNPVWRTPAAVALARSMYEERRFEDMPLLGDALEEAGCTDAQVLAHCRQAGEHVRGCCVVDLVLGRD